MAVQSQTVYYSVTGIILIVISTAHPFLFPGAETTPPSGARTGGEHSGPGISRDKLWFFPSGTYYPHNRPPRQVAACVRTAPRLPMCSPASATMFES